MVLATAPAICLKIIWSKKTLFLIIFSSHRLGWGIPLFGQLQIHMVGQFYPILSPFPKFSRFNPRFLWLNPHGQFCSKIIAVTAATGPIIPASMDRVSDPPTGALPPMPEAIPCVQELLGLDDDLNENIRKSMVETVETMVFRVK